MPDWLIVVLGIGIGFATGILSGMFGIGGAVVSTPAIQALGATPYESVGSTVPAIIPGAISGTLRYLRDGYVHLDSVAWVAGPGIIATITGARLTRVVPGDGHLLMIVTALLVGYSGWQTARGSDAKRDLDAAAARRDSWWRLALIGIAAGMLSGLLGVGGGILMVPLFVQWLHMPIKNAIGTSLACVGIFAVPSAVVHQLQGDINWLYAAPLCVAVIPGARLGAHLAITSAEHLLRRAVGAFLGIISVVYAAGNVYALVKG